MVAETRARRRSFGWCSAHSCFGSNLRRSVAKASDKSSESDWLSSTVGQRWRTETEARTEEEDRRLSEALLAVEAETSRTTLITAGVATLCATALGFITFSPFADALRAQVEADGLAVLANDQGQYFQNYVNAVNVLFSLFASNTLVLLYGQQESVYVALFLEVSIAKSLLEQVAFVSRGREAYALELLTQIERYVEEDLRALDTLPVVLLSKRQDNDPLESLMWLTSVGAPGLVYETVKDLRIQRGVRLGALQRKLPAAHFALLAVLAGFVLAVFPLLAAATGSAQKALADESLIDVQAILFSFMTAGLALTLRLLYAFWTPTGSAYNVDAVLAVMIAGLQDEISDRKNLATRNLQRKQHSDDTMEKWTEDSSSTTDIDGDSDEFAPGSYYPNSDSSVDNFPSRDASPPAFFRRRPNR